MCISVELGKICSQRKGCLEEPHPPEGDPETSGTQYDFTVGCFHAGSVTATHQVANACVLQQRWSSFLKNLINNLMKVAVEQCFNPSVMLTFLHKTAEEYGGFSLYEDLEQAVDVIDDFCFQYHESSLALHSIFL